MFRSRVQLECFIIEQKFSLNKHRSAGGGSDAYFYKNIEAQICPKIKNKCNCKFLLKKYTSHNTSRPYIMAFHCRMQVFRILQLETLSEQRRKSKLCRTCFMTVAKCIIGGGREGQGGRPPPPTFLQVVFFLHVNARHSKPKSQADADMQPL